MNQPPIQFPLHPSSPIRNSYSGSSSSHVGNGGNELDVGMDELLGKRSAMDAMLFHTILDNELGDNACITKPFFQILKIENSTIFFEDNL